jgi:hypothetical protein
MNIKEMQAVIESTQGYREFMEKYPDAYLAIGFFIIDFDNESATQKQLDYYIPSRKKIGSFDLLGNYKVSEQLVEKELLPMGNATLGVDEVIEIVKSELNKREILLGLQKVIAILSRIDMELSWSVNVILTTTDFIKMKVKDDDSSVGKFEMINLASLIKIRKKPQTVDGDVQFYEIKPDAKNDRPESGLG